MADDDIKRENVLPAVENLMDRRFKDMELPGGGFVLMMFWCVHGRSFVYFVLLIEKLHLYSEFVHILYDERILWFVYMSLIVEIFLSKIVLMPQMLSTHILHIFC